jgi:PAS domain S-box-containing protein
VEHASLSRSDTADAAFRALRGIVDFAPVGIAQFDVAGRFLLVNQRLCTIFGFTHEELTARTFQEITFPDDLPACLHLTGELASGKLPRYRHDKRFVRRDGSVIWVCVTVGAVRDETGAPAFFVGMAEDITEERASEERRRVAEERLEAALAASTTGTFRWDIVSGQLWWDRNLYRLMGLPPRDAMLGVEESMATVHPEDREALARAVERCGTEGGSFKQEFRVIWPDGEVRCLRCLGNTLADGDGKPSHMTGAVTDMTDAWRDRLQTEAARAQAERASRMRDDMLAVVAHDLRNPVHTIGMAAGVLQQPMISEQQRTQLVRTIARTVAGMERLLNDLLDVSRMDEGTFGIVRGTFSPRELLDTVRELFEAKARERGLQLHCEARELGSLEGDHDRLVQVLSNLVGNALRYARRPGGVRIEAAPCAEGARFTVRDNGPGIPAEDQPRLFDRFWQRDPQSGGGAGLGLAIAKGIVEAHAGRIWVESDASGSAFHFTVPLTPPG